MENYAQTMERLFQANSTLSSKWSLDNALAFDQALDFPTRSYATIHVAGSNGKGSVTTKIAKTLELSGYRVGQYTSPHLDSFRERIAVNGALISEQDILEGMQKIFSFSQKLGLKATFFEMTTFLAFDYFRKMNVDIAVIETGLGGRLDATNIINPVISIITSISLEHSQILGNELEQIAAEKAGIIKEKIPVILGPKARFQSIYDRAKELDSPILASRKISYFFDEENIAIAQLALDQLADRFTIAPLAVEQGTSIRPPCRFERIGEAILDVAHNPEAVFYLLQALHTFFPQAKFRFLVGFSKDKQYDQCLDLIAQVATQIHFVQAGTPRAATLQELIAALKKEDPAFSIAHSSIEEGVKQAYTCALAEGEILVICGSFYIMAEAKKILELYPPAGSLDLNEKTFSSVFSSSMA